MRAVKQKVWNEAENRERDWEKVSFSLRACETLTRALDSYAALYRYLNWFWEKNRLFCSVALASIGVKERTGAREGDTQGERERLPERPMKIVSRPLSNYLKAAAWSVKYFDRNQLTSTLGTRGFSRVRWEFSVLAEGRHIFGRRPKPRAAKLREKLFARVTIKTWQKTETALEKSLAPRVIDFAQTKRAKALYIYILGLNISVIKIS